MYTTLFTFKSIELASPAAHTDPLDSTVYDDCYYIVAFLNLLSTIILLRFVRCVHGNVYLKRLRDAHFPAVVAAGRVTRSKIILNTTSDKVRGEIEKKNLTHKIQIFIIGT